MALPSTTFAKLVPLIQPDHPAGGCSRPTLSVYGSLSIILGRNSVTRITSLEISRQLARVEWRDGTLQVVCLKPANAHHLVVSGQLVSHNNPIPLSHGDVISLRNHDFSYQIQVCLGGSSSTGVASVACAQNDLLDETCCPICIELVVRSTALNPCGHVFCHGCLPKPLRKCPTCQQKVTSTLPIRTLDNIVWKLVEGHNFDQDEVSSYLRRSQKKLTEEQTKELLGGRPPRKRSRSQKSPPSLISETFGSDKAVAKAGHTIGASVDDAICID